MKLADRLAQIGYERVRIAIALLSLSFFSVLYIMVAINPPPGWRAAFLGLALCYMTAFLALASEWFWGRWVASGLGWSGLMLSAVSLVMLGWQPVLLAYGALHGAVVAMLAGKRIAVRFEQRPGWRDRFGLDDLGVARIQRFVTRGAGALPSLIVWALGPREGQGGWSSLAAVLLVVGGLAGVLTMRTWGVLVMAAAAIAVGVAGGSLGVLPSATLVSTWNFPAAVQAWGGATATLSFLLAAAVLPFVGAIWRYCRAGRTIRDP